MVLVIFKLFSPMVHLGALPSPLDEYVKFEPIGNTYQPIFFFNDYWNLGAEFMPINDTLKELNFTLTYAPLSLFKWQLYASQQVSIFDDPSRLKITELLNRCNG